MGDDGVPTRISYVDLLNLWTSMLSDSINQHLFDLLFKISKVSTQGLYISLAYAHRYEFNTTDGRLLNLNYTDKRIVWNEVNYMKSDLSSVF